MKLVKTLLWMAAFLFCVPAWPQDLPPATANLYVIALNGQAVTIDGVLQDWRDAEFVYLSQDGPTHGLFTGAKPTTSPADFSGHVAIKMDNDNIYFAAHVRDEGGILIHPPRTRQNANLTFAFDHLAVYLGLYDIGTQPGSPHRNTVDLIDPASGQIVQGGRTYRIKPGTDNDPDNATLGPDYQFGVNFQTYDKTLANGAYSASGDEVINFNWGYVDTLIANTELAIKPWSNERGFTLEWRVPFASLAGKIARASKPQAALEWPLYRPQAGDVIPFDIDLTDDDRLAAPEDFNNNFLGLGRGSNLWRDSFAWEGRGVVVDVSGGKNAGNYYHAGFATPAAGVTVDGDLAEWATAQFIGISQDSPNHQYIFQNGDVLSSPADFGGYIAVRLDQDNIYFAARVRDEPQGTGAFQHTRRTKNDANLMFTQEHLAIYLGLYDIGDLPRSPHIRDVNIIDPATGQIVAGGRTHRIKPGTDDDPDQATRGADFQLGVNIQTYDNTLANGAFHAQGLDVINYAWSYVDTFLTNTELALLQWTDEKGYDLEWRLPLASLAGKIAKQVSPQKNIEWPRYVPQDRHVIPFDIDLTDEDRVNNQDGTNSFLRMGRGLDLWRDAAAFGMRLKVIGSPCSITAVEQTPAAAFVREYRLLQNYPNPFNPGTTIAFELPAAAPVSLKVFNLAGQEITTLVNRSLVAGRYQVTWTPRSEPSGLYLYRLQAGDHVQTGRMLYLK